MPEITYRFDPEGTSEPKRPADAAAALALLRAGNEEFVDFFGESRVIDLTPEELGISLDGFPSPQRPFAAILGCADARVPIEFIFRCRSNQLFVVRVAGNVAGTECLGSLEYAEAQLSESMRVAVVLGHTGCGAVTAAVDAYLDIRTYPDSPTLRAVVDRILPAVRVSAVALAEAYGDSALATPAGRDALIECSVVMNAALSATTVRDDLAFPVHYGVFDMATRRAWIDEPPVDADAYVALAQKVATADPIRRILEP